MDTEDSGRWVRLVRTVWLVVVRTDGWMNGDVIMERMGTVRAQKTNKLTTIIKQLE